MGRKCAVPRCGSEARKCTDNGDGIKTNVHKFPADVKIREQWIKAIPGREWNWQPTEYSGVCSLHFKSHDYKSASSDSNKYREKKDESLERRILLPGAIRGFRLFNVMSKNYVSELNDKIDSEKKRKQPANKDPGAMKIAKLTSKS